MLVVCVLAAGLRQQLLRQVLGRSKRSAEEEEALGVSVALIKRPLGIVLTERDGGGVRVTAMDPRGNAVRASADVGSTLLDKEG